MLYWELTLDKNYHAEGANAYVQDRQVVEVRNECYNTAIAKMRKLIDILGFNDKTDLLQIRLRLHNTPLHEFEVLSSWTSMPFSNNKPLLESQLRALLPTEGCDA